jgi:hypothetical protein
MNRICRRSRRPEIISVVVAFIFTWLYHLPHPDSDLPRVLAPSLVTDAPNHHQPVYNSLEVI